MSNCEITILIKLSIFNAANREPVCSSGIDHAGIAATEAEAASLRAANRTTPIEAGGTAKLQGTI